MKLLLLFGPRGQTFNSQQKVEFLKISTDENIDMHLDECITWTEAGNSSDNPITLELYGTLVIWTSIRMVLVTSPRHFQKAERALLDFTKIAFEMTAIEGLLSTAWKHYEDDLPSGFSCHESNTSTKATLSNRYVQAMSLSGKIARLSPRIHLPPEHPPTTSISPEHLPTLKTYPKPTRKSTPTKPIFISFL